MARAVYLRPFFEVRYDVAPSAVPGLEYRRVDLCYWEQAVAIGEHGVSVLEERRIIEAVLEEEVLGLAVRHPAYADATGTVVELSPALDLRQGRTPVLAAPVLSRGSLPGASEDNERAPLRQHLLDHLVVRFEADLVHAFGPSPDRGAALAAARERWGALPASAAPGP
ncbi:MAG TPA: hypothetical protein VMB72_15885, partial [Acidimicrobiales bacterium]|nr:hypothetical protein [Acidimicrobiales bacterium]